MVTRRPSWVLGVPHDSPDPSSVAASAISIRRSGDLVFGGLVGQQISLGERLVPNAGANYATVGDWLKAKIDGFVEELLAKTGRNDLRAWAETLRLGEIMGRAGRRVLTGYLASVVILAAGLIYRFH